MVSLGCAKNLVDAEIMLGSVLARGMEITSSADEADVLVVNTCAFIDSAKEESINAILAAHQARGLNKRAGQRLIVSGCMSQRFARELRQEMPEVDAFVGLDEVKELGTIVERVLANKDVDLAFAEARPTYIPDYDTPRFRLTPAHSVYVKIAEGCNHPCSFCVIPQMRGKHRSRSMESVLAEIRGLVAEGVDAGLAIARDPENRRRFLGPTALHPPGALERRINRDDRRLQQSRVLHRHPASAHTRIDAAKNAPGNVALSHRELNREASCRNSGSGVANNVHRRFPRRDRR